MLEAYAVNKTIAANDLIPFDSVSLLKGQTAVLSGASSIQLNRCGVYMISAVFTGTPAAAGAVSIEMLRNGVVQPQASANLAAELTTVSVAVPISTLVQVSENNGNCCCKSGTIIQFRNSGVGLNAARTSIIITKVC